MSDKTPEQHARQFLEFIEDGGRSALKWSALKLEKKLASEDREAIEKERGDIKKGLRHLRPAFDELCKCFIEPLRETKPSLADHGYEKLWAVIGWAWAIGSRSHVSDSVNGYLQAERAKSPRANPFNEKIMEELSREPGLSAKEVGRRLGLETGGALDARVSRIKGKQKNSL